MGVGYVKPNVSLCDDKGKVYYNLNANGHPYVDLGLPSGTLWATMNVGALKPSDYGLYFQWGDPVGYTADQVGKDKQFNWSDYKWYLSGKDDDDSLRLKKYTTTSAKLELEDDAAHANMGGSWHIPTPNQIRELRDNTTSKWTTQDGVIGRLFTSKKDQSKSIFIPAAGYANGGIVDDYGRPGKVWSSMLSTSNVSDGENLHVSLKYTYLGSSSRYLGYSVRGVLG